MGKLKLVLNKSVNKHLAIQHLLNNLNNLRNAWFKNVFNKRGQICKRNSENKTISTEILE